MISKSTMNSWCFLHVFEIGLASKLKVKSGSGNWTWIVTISGWHEQHGFARNVSWDISSTESDADSTTVVLELKPSTYSRNMWDYEFVVNFKVSFYTVQYTVDLVSLESSMRFCCPRFRI
jgi:hypothetical protein